MIGYNCSGKFSCPTSSEAVLDVVSSSFPDWQILFLTECDYVHSSSFALSSHLPHRLFRHWPGPGSHAFCFVVHASLSNVSCSFRFLNRCASLQITSDSLVGNHSLQLVGVHGPHCQVHEFLDFTADVGHPISERRGECKTLLLGDWNADIASSFQHCPSLNVRDVQTERKDIIESLCAENEYDLLVPEHMIDLPSVRDCHRNLCAEFCFTRVPLGDQPGAPTLLDFGIGSRGLVSECLETCPWGSFNNSLYFRVQHPCPSF